MNNIIFILVVFFSFLSSDTVAQQAGFKDSVDFYYIQGDYIKAKYFGERELERTKLLGEFKEDYAVALSDMGTIHYVLGDYYKAILCSKSALEIQKKLTGENDNEYAAKLMNLGNSYNAIGNNKDAEQSQMQALKIFRALGYDGEEVGTLLNNIGNLYQNMGRFTDSRIFFLEALNHREKDFGKNSLEYALGLNNIGVLNLITGNLEDAETALLQALNIRRKAVMKNLPDLAFSLSNLASLYTKLGNFRAAEPMILEALEIRKKTIGIKHPDYATSLNNLANFYKLQKKYKAADSAYRVVLEILKLSGGEANPYYITVLTNLAATLGEVRNFNESISISEKALEICKKNAGVESIPYANILRNLARAYYFTGDYPKAYPLFLQSIKTLKTLVGEYHPDYITSSIQFSDLFNAMNKTEEGLQNLISLMEVEKKSLLSKLNYLSEKELMPYLKEREYTFGIPFSSLLHCNSAELLKVAYNSRLFFKGVALQSSKSLSDLMENSADSTLVLTWKKFKRNISVTNASLALPISKRTLNLDSLTDITNQQQKELLRESSFYRDMKSKLNITLQDIHSTLHFDEAAIEFLYFTSLKKNKDAEDTIFYAAMLLRPQDSVPVFIKLFEESQFKKALKNFPYKAAGNSVSAKANNKKSKNSIYKLLWQPLEPYLKKNKTIYFSPDGLLHQIAFAAIPYGKDSLLSDKYNLVQLTSTRQLAIKDSSEPTPASIALFGGIDYNRQNTDTSIKSLADPYSYVYQQNRSAGLDSFVYLPNTLKEVTGIKKLMQLKQKKVFTYSKDMATEAAFRSLGGASSPTVIHFATHGFALPDAEKPKGVTNTFKVSDNPLLRSGLIMAGGNKGWKGKSGLDEDDGILTALEISSVYLPNTQLVVLSACETGVGELRGSEGVFGLQRAFKLAGVNYVMASLWSVPDKETNEFMNYFYDKWLSGSTILEAFFYTQRTMSKKYSPLYWAAFTLVQ